MSFQCRYGWHCQFMEQDLKTPLARKLHFKSAEKVIELVVRGGGLSNLESRQALDQAIEIGRGGVFLSLTEEQYAKAEDAMLLALYLIQVTLEQFCQGGESRYPSLPNGASGSEWLSRGLFFSRG
jgi:hypothetical protein